MSQCSGGSCQTCSDDPDRLPPGMLRRYDLNESTADGIMVWIETDGGKVSRPSAEILAAAKGLTDGRLYGVIFGDAGLKSEYPRIFGYGVDTLYHVRGIASYSPEAYAEAVSQVAERVNPAAILISATPRGRELAPRIASLLGAGLTADCTRLESDGRRIVMTRPAFGGNLMADIECVGFPQMATVRPGVFPLPEPKEGKGTAIYWQYPPEQDSGVVSEEAVQTEAADISDARILIALGAGIRDRGLVDVAEEIAASIDGAMVCCSRAVAERGWLPRSRQVGMSGRTVRPDLYVAFGISGAVQHRVGISGAKRIIAVNSDPEAPIHAFSDLSLLTDAEEALKELRDLVVGKPRRRSS